MSFISIRRCEICGFEMGWMTVGEFQDTHRHCDGCIESCEECLEENEDRESEEEIVYERPFDE